MFRYCMLLLLGLTGCSVSADERPPNVVILFADDLGYADLGSYGNPYIRTPNLDELAREGQRWTDFYMASPVCSPSRGALLTGQWSVRSGLYGRKVQVMFPGDRHGVPHELLTLPEALKSAGYGTGIFGKWHLGDAPEQFPTRHGFDYWFGIPYSNDMDRVGGSNIEVVMKALATGDFSQLGGQVNGLYESFRKPRIENYQVPLYRSEHRGQAIEDALLERPVDQYTFTRRVTEEAIRFIKQNADSPFFVYVPYSMPHLPLFASEDFAGKSLRGPYGDTVEEIDWSVGRIRAVLEQIGVAGNTLIVFSSDNGPWQQASTVGAGSAGVLRGDKGTTWEGGVRVPGIFWWPGKIKPRVVSDIGSSTDLYATILSIVGLSLPEATDGLDLAPALFGDAHSPRDEMPYYHRGELKAFRKGHYKVVFFAGERSDRKLETPMLFDLRQDISERTDIAAERPDVLSALLHAVEAHRSRVPIADPVFDQRIQPYL